VIIEVSGEIAKAIGDPELILIYVVIVGLFAKIFLDSKTIRDLSRGLDKHGQAISDISKLLHTLLLRDTQDRRK